MSARVLLVPGLGNSGPEHWQSHWQRDFGFERVMQKNGDTPDRHDWIEALHRAIAASDRPAILVGHSLGCALIVHWSAAHAGPVRGALLVAPSDTEAPSYPPGTTGFTPMPMNRLPFASIVACSTDDVYVPMDRARAFARAWGSQLEFVGTLGHIDADARLGLWPQGLALLKRLLD